MEYLFFSDEEILYYVDEYSLYCHYLGYIPLIKRLYHSPIRDDDHTPSFVLIPNKNKESPFQYMWIDYGVALTKNDNNIFTLISKIYNISYVEAKIKVCRNFGLGGEIKHEDLKVIRPLPTANKRYTIEIKSKAFTISELSYFHKYNINTSLLKRYNVYSVNYFFINQKIQKAKTMAFAYRIKDKFQLYFPFDDKRCKFRNNWDYTCVPGLEQLQYKDTLIITKSLKDVMCLASFGYDSISPRSECILLPKEIINFIFKKYKNIFVLFDNDGKHNASDYPFPQIQVPPESGTKDISDYHALYGSEKTNLLIKTLLYDQH